MIGARVVVHTDKGQVRTVNEDHVGAFGWLAPADMTSPVELRVRAKDPLVIVVADGLGGHAAGAMASELAVSRMMAEPAELVTPDGVANRCATIHTELLGIGREQPGKQGMATTLAVVVIAEDRTIVGNVGDTRVYWVEPGLVDEISVDDVEPMGSALTQVLGGWSEAPVKPHLSELPAEPGTRLLLCSDGLHGYVGFEKLRAAAAIGDTYVAASALATLTQEAGAPDNVSLCVVEILQWECTDD